MTAVESEMHKFAAGLLPVNPVAGEEVSWTVEERLAHYNCPGVAVCVIRDGDIVDAAGFGAIGGPAWNAPDSSAAPVAMTCWHAIRTATAQAAICALAPAPGAITSAPIPAIC